MERQILGDMKPYNSQSFFRINKIQRYTQHKNGGRHTTFNATEKSDYHMYFVPHTTLQVNNNGTVYNMTGPEMLIYQPFGEQEIISPAYGNYVHCIFSGTCVEEILRDISLLTDTVYHISPCYESGESYLFYNKQIEYVINETNKGKKYCETSSACMLIEFFTLFLRNCTSSDADPNLKQIEPAISYILANIESDLDIDALINLTHLSKSRFYALFKHYTGTSPLRFQTNYRLSAAADYMIIYNMKVREASEKLGFQDPLYFSRLFKKEFGLSPRDYVKLHKEHKNIII